MKIQIKPSYFLLLIQIVLLSLAISAVLVVDLSLLLKIMLLIVILFYFGFFVIKNYFYFFNRIEAIEIKDVNWMIYLYQEQKPILVDILSTTVVSRFYLSVHFKTVGLRKTYRLFILRDSLTSEKQFRYLANALFSSKS